jgi:hypothetical protein
VPNPYYRLRRAAWHQAGHAVAAVALGLPVRSVSLHKQKTPADHSWGGTDCPVESADLLGIGAECAVPYIACSLAGPVAESPESAFRSESDGRIDAEQANYRAILALREAGDNSPTVLPGERERNADQIDKLLVAGAELADRIVNTHRAAIDSVANALLRRIALTGEEVVAIVGDD